MKKLIISASTAAMILASVTPVPTTYGAGTFVDIESSYAKDAITELQEMGILTGVDNAHFNPKDTLTRAQFVTILVKALGLEATASASSFSDVTGWAIPYVEAAIKAGIVKGVSETNFAPESVLTREEAATMLVRALQLKGKLDEGNELSFTDADTISDWALEYIVIAQQYGLITGNPDGTFNPKGSANREMAAVMAKNLLTAVEKIEAPQPPVEPVPTPTPSPNPGNGGGSSGGGGGGGSHHDDDEVESITVTAAGEINTITTKGGTLQLEAHVLPSDADNKTVTWSVSNDNTTIDENGFLTAVKDGVVTVTAAAKDGSGVTGTLEITISNQTTPPVEEAPAISSISIVSSGANPAYARVGDTVTLTFTTDEEVFKLSNFKINGSNPTTFESVHTGDIWTNTATYVIEESDPEGVMTFQINVKNAAGIYSVTTESTTDGSSVTVTKSPEILSVGIVSNNENHKYAKVGDTVTLTFTTKEEVHKLGNFKINGSNPTTFDSVGEGDLWTNTATYVIEESEPEGIMTFQINVENAGGFYSITTEATTDGSSVTVQKAPLISAVSIASTAAHTSKAAVGDTVTLTFTTNQEVFKLGNFKINGSNPVAFGSIAEEMGWKNTATYVIDESDPVGAMNFQINVRNGAGLYSITTEQTTDESSVEVVAPIVAEDFGKDVSDAVYGGYNIGFNLDLSYLDYDSIESVTGTVYDGETVIAEVTANTPEQIEKYKQADEEYGELDGQLSFGIVSEEALDHYEIPMKVGPDGESYYTTSYLQYTKPISEDYTTGEELPTSATVVVIIKDGRKFTATYTLN